MDKGLEIIPFAMIAVILLIWLFIRTRKPDLKGLDTGRMRFRLDHVELERCHICGDGFMEPRFRWWRFFFCFGFFPFFIYVLGQPDEYRCTSCGHASETGNRQGIATRISLSQTLPAAYVVAQIVMLILAGAVLIMMLT